MQSLAAVTRPRMSETESKWFMFETSSYAFGGRIRRFATVNVNKVNIVYCIVLILVASCFCLDIHFHDIDNTFFIYIA